MPAVSWPLLIVRRRRRACFEGIDDEQSDLMNEDGDGDEAMSGQA